MTTGPERIRAAVERDRGMSTPTQRATLCGTGDPPPDAKRADDPGWTDAATTERQRIADEIRSHIPPPWSKSEYWDAWHDVVDAVETNFAATLDTEPSIGRPQPKDTRD